MYRLFPVWILLLTISPRNIPLSVGTHDSVNSIYGGSEQDTLLKKQSLYSGKVWKKNHRRIEGNPFLFSNYFLPGTVSLGGKTFKNLLIRYDIFSDEITIPVNLEEIIQLNKEMIDSFSINFENKVYCFSKITEDSLSGIKGFKGYFCVLHNNATALYLKYRKYILPASTEKSDGEFVQTYKIYFVKDSIVYPVANKKDLYKALDAENEQVREYLKANKIKVTMTNPESFVPVVRYYEGKNR